MSLPLAAHPHMSMSARLDFELEGASCTGFWEEWTLDPIFSASIIAEQDADRNAKIEGDEVLGVEDAAFSNLYRYGYFTLIRVGQTRTSPRRVERFDAWVSKGSLVYRFFVRLPEPLSADFAVAVFDTTYFCAVKYPSVAATFTRKVGSGATPSWSAGVNRAFPVYYDPLQPIGDTKVHTKPGPGLITTYPEEVLVSFAR